MKSILKIFAEYVPHKYVNPAHPEDGVQISYEIRPEKFDELADKIVIGRNINRENVLSILNVFADQKLINDLSHHSYIHENEFRLIADEILSNCG
jgi:hypothetical protein